MSHPRLRNRPFSLREARALGVEPVRLSRSELVTPFRGARVPARLAADFVARCAALCAREPGGVLSHATAAILLGLPDTRWLPGVRQQGARAHLPPPDSPSASALHHHLPPSDAPPTHAQPVLHLTVAPPARPPRLTGVQSHSRPLSAGETCRVRGLPVTSAARTWADLAATASIRELVVLGDAVLGGRAPLASHDDVRAAVPPAGARGASRARTAVELLDGRAESPPESLLRLILAEAGLPAPDVNVDLHTPDGRFLARPELRFAPYRTIVEYEGDHHRIEPRQWRRDLTRTTALQQQGELVLRVGAEHLRSEKRLVGLVFRSLASRGWDPS
ncbi:hypothetical protein [Leifsonia sp. PS1209]|uniref:hypothetical protein n=1 Tax=Leifsonia sp. PS1209 TaxID=2724914 RepID=UPI001442A869|nr:hypothetical protein [Leifsonia sp. PS1209]QJA00048.1 hypothetical protein HF024_17090 [Leifsonia sp. PS1209]